METTKIKTTVLSAFVIIFLLLPKAVLSQSDNEITVGKVFVGELDYKGFSLSKDSKIKIDGNAARFDNKRRDGDRDPDFYGWILDSKTRKVVWHLFEDYDDADNKHGIFSVKTEINLKAGNYEVYYTANTNDGDSYFSFGGFLDNIFRSNKSQYRTRDREKLYLKIAGQSGIFKSNNGEVEVDKLRDQAVASIIRVGDDEEVQKGFSLKAATKLRVYALGEGRQREIFDYAWISNAKTGERVWEMDNWDADYAGGGRKNLLFNEEIELPAGSYFLNYVSDDSHSFYDWNVYPPNDPQFWGVTLYAVSSSDKANVVPFKAVETVKPVVELTKIRDDEFVSQGISVKKPMKLRVFCLGEGTGYEMADYGWIVNAKTRQPFWEMSKSKTEHAGGASKNRMVDEVVEFPKGDYIVYYSTDDSHAYNDWNSSPPYERNRWGITLWAVNEEDKKSVELFDEKKFMDENVIVEITRVRDDERLSKSFTLDKETKIRILAIGEGFRNEMADYGWIKNTDNNKVVWEMTYRTSEHAGGADKNRMFNDTITLPKGNYKVFYETDGSHSYRDWNAGPPYDQEKYGITIYKEK